MCLYVAMDDLYFIGDIWNVALLAVYQVWMVMMNIPLIELNLIIDLDRWLGLIINMDGWLGLIIVKDDFSLDHY